MLSRFGEDPESIVRQVVPPLPHLLQRLRLLSAHGRHVRAHGSLCFARRGLRRLSLTGRSVPATAALRSTLLCLFSGGSRPAKHLGAHIRAKPQARWERALHNNYVLRIANTTVFAATTYERNPPNTRLETTANEHVQTRTSEETAAEAPTSSALSFPTGGGNGSVSHRSLSWARGKRTGPAPSH